MNNEHKDRPDKTLSFMIEWSMFKHLPSVGASIDIDGLAYFIYQFIPEEVDGDHYIYCNYLLKCYSSDVSECSHALEDFHAIAIGELSEE